MLSKEMLSRIRRLEIKTSHLVEGALAGGYLSTFKGRGIEFTEVREYAEGDDVRAIDWNVTARMSAPYVKTFVEERDLTVMLAVDLSGSMDFGTTAQSKRELALDFSAAAALLAVKNNDRVGLLAYTDRVESYVPPRKGRRHVMRVLAELASLRPVGAGSEHALAASYLMKALKRRSTFFWLSDFIGVSGARPLKAVSRRHELVPVVLQDRRELEMPRVGLVELVDPETGEGVLVDTADPAFQETFGRGRERVEQERAALIGSLRAEPLEVFTGGSPVTALTRYFRRKMRHRRH